MNRQIRQTMIGHQFCANTDGGIFALEIPLNQDGQYLFLIALESCSDKVLMVGMSMSPVTGNVIVLGSLEIWAGVREACIDQCNSKISKFSRAITCAFLETGNLPKDLNFLFVIIILASIGSATSAQAQVTNGDFSSGGTGWTTNAPADSTLSYAGNQLTTVSDNNGGANSRTYASQSLTTTDPGFLSALLVNYTTTDVDLGQWDYPSVLIGPTFYWLTTAGGITTTAASGVDNDDAPITLTMRTTLTAGTRTIGFGVTSVDSQLGPGTAIWDDIDFQELTQSPGAQSVDEDNVLTLSGANAPQVATNSGATSMTVTLTVTNGVLDLSTTAGLTITSGGDGTATVTFNGTPAAINTAMAGMTYTPTADYNGAATLTFTATGGGLTDTDTVAITVNSIPDYAFTINKVADLANVTIPGQVITYTITVTNTGDTALTSITFTDDVDQNGSSTALTPTGPTGDGGVVGTMEVAEVWVYTATHAVTQAQMDDGNDLVNTGTFNPTEMAAQSDTATTTITTNPSISVTKTADLDTNVPAGQTVTYTYVVTNDGNQTIASISLADLHGGSGPAPSPGSETLTDNIPLGDSTDAASNGIWDSLAPGDIATFTGTYVVTQQDVDTLQ